MSDKPKKPFLKKGTRQFLSNAQVRSQINKPKVVDFGESQDNQVFGKPVDLVEVKPKPVLKNQAGQKQIPRVKPPSNHRREDSNEPERKIVELRNRVRAQEDDDVVFVERDNKSKKPNVVQQKSEAKTRDQLKQNQRKVENNLDFYLNKKKKNNFTNNFDNDSQQPKSNKKPTKKFMIQDEQTEQKQQDFEVNYRGKHQQCENKPQREDYDVEVEADRFKQEEQERRYGDKSEYNFDDDAVLDRPKNTMMKRPNLKKQMKEEKKMYEEEGDVQPPPRKSKLVEKFFYGSDVKNQQRPPESRKTQQPKAITVENVPEEVKLKIVEESVMKFKERLQEEVDRVKAEGDAVRRVKIKYEEEMRQFERAKKDFEKEMETKRVQFEEYMKEERAKIQKDKRVIKDGLENRYTRKEKQQIEELRKEAEDAKEDKKKTESRMRVEIDRLKKKVEEEAGRNKMLQEQIRILQLGRIQQERAAPIVHKPIAQPKPQPPKSITLKGITSDPQIQLMKTDSFCLSDLPIVSYLHTANLFYKDYCIQREDEEQLLSETQQPNRVKRIYKGGKIEYEYYKKFIKETFPNGYSIVHHCNTDVKQKLPNDEEIYYASVNQAVEFTFGKEQKIILFFIEKQQVEMRTKKPNGEYFEVYDGNSLMKTYPDGHTQVTEANGQTTITRGNTKVKQNTVSYPRNLRNI